MDENLLSLLVENAAEAARIARAITPGQLADPTPCPEFDTRTLINHWVLYTSYGLEHRARREDLPEDLRKRDFAAEPDWAGQYQAALGRAVDAWSVPAAWDGAVDFGGGAMVPIEDVFLMNLGELALHGWDVAKATGQDYRASAGTGETVLRFAENYAEMYRSYDGFAQPVPVAEDASAFERAVALTGRDPGWPKNS
ncbi:MAG TPA: TIGR03086 family metal-binding protein [Actinocrinis sp.]|nr:TIGR03086 family metal-binding protein [Actinocrinis sp.]